MELLQRLERWTRWPQSEGADLRGPAGERVRVRVGVSPIPTLTTAISAEIDPAARPITVERLRTLEGEPVAFATGTGWALAVAIGDERADVIAGRGDVDSVVRELAIHAFLGLGEVRRRRAYYVPPAGWRGVARPHAARWLHPEYPRMPHVLVVYHARPTASACELVDRLFVTSSTHGRALEAPHALAPCRTPMGLTGNYARIDHRERGELHTVVRCALVDDRFTYVAELAGPAVSAARDLGALETLVSTIEPIPYASSQRSERVLYWGDD